MFNVSYGNSEITLKFPDSVRVDCFEPVSFDKVLSCEDFLAYMKQYGPEFLAGEIPLVVVNDGFRSTPTSQVLAWLEVYNPLIIEKATFLVACGTHPLPTNVHFRKIFGDFYPRIKERLVCHNASDTGSLKSVGRDRFGEDVLVNRLLLESERVLFITSVEPHYFAGFTGGRKSIFPGLSDFDTVVRNHNLANSLEAAPMKLDGNPVAEHLEELLSLIDDRSFFSLQVLLDAGGQLVGMFTGNLREAFREAISMAREIYEVKASEKYDAVICEMFPPLDNDLYQAQKALENCQAGVKNGGAAIVVSSCDEGVGSKYFFELAQKWDAENNKTGDDLEHFGSHKLSRVLSMKKRIDVFLHSSLPDDTVRQVFYEPLKDIQEFLNKQIENNKYYTVGIVRDAGSTVLNA